MAPRSKSTYSSHSSVKLRSITIMYDSKKKFSFVLWLEAQEQSQRQIAMAKMVILRSRGQHGAYTQGKPNMISQDPSMGLV